MNGNVFQCFDKCEDKKQSTNTVETLGEYIVKHQKYPGDMTSLYKQLVTPTVEEPDDLPEMEKDQLKVALWEKKVSAYCARVNDLDSNLKATFAVIWGQCSDMLKAKLTTLNDFIQRDNNTDCEWLLKEIKAIMFQFDGQCNIFLSLNDAET